MALGVYVSGYGRGGAIEQKVPGVLVEEAEQLRQAPYPPSEWDKATWIANSPQESLLQKYGPVRYEAYLRSKTDELSSWHPNWMTFIGLGAAAIALVFRWRKR